jgi:methionyl-tRNA synthetase
MRDSDSTRKFYVTTPIYYVTDKPHLGNSYPTIAADVLARFHRLRGDDVFFLTGTDEHAIKVMRAAEAQGKSTREFVDDIVGVWQKTWERMHVAYDRFIRTTEPAHVAAVQAVVARLQEQGDIYRDEYHGWYCVPCETFFREDDLCEGACPDCRRPVEQLAQPAYFFRTSAYAERLLRYLEENPEFIQPETRRREVVSFIEGGLRDACISRKHPGWGIAMPQDPEHSVYVWVDALINYLTAAGYPDPASAQWRWWPPEVQLVGKDILTRFHATIWPAMLMALELPLPRCIFAHGWWVTDSGDKMSKSRGNVMDPWEVARDLAEVSGATTPVAVDAVRFFVLREVTFGLDGSFSMSALLGRFNADLANDLGNLLNRTLPLVERYRQGLVPEPGPGAGGLREAIDRARIAVEERLEELDFRGALEAIWELLAAGNKFVDTREPWTLHREAKEVELDAVLYDLADCLRVLAIFVSPFMPAVGAEIWERLGLIAAGVEPAWKEAEAGRLPPGLQVDAGRPLFPRVELERALQRLEAKLEKSTAPEEPMASKAETISYEQFRQMDLRTGKVVEVERAPGSDKLYRVLVDLGEETPRQMVAGLAQDFAPEELQGKMVVVVANLEPASIRGIRSYGMLLAVGEEKPLALVTTDRDCPPGSVVR